MHVPWGTKLPLIENHGPRVSLGAVQMRAKSSPVGVQDPREIDLNRSFGVQLRQGIA